jgi:hypothetical protein
MIGTPMLTREVIGQCSLMPDYDPQTGSPLNVIMPQSDLMCLLTGKIVEGLVNGYEGYVTPLTYKNNEPGIGREPATC